MTESELPEPIWEKCETCGCGSNHHDLDDYGNRPCRNPNCKCGRFLKPELQEKE